MARHTYRLQALHPSLGWQDLAGGQTGREYGLGYIAARCEAPGPRVAVRLVRDDGHVVDAAPGIEGASIGAVAGWPTAEQYRRAAERCLALARAIEERERGRAGGGR